MSHRHADAVAQRRRWRAPRAAAVTPTADGSPRPGRPASSARAEAVRARRAAYRDSVGDSQAFDALRGQLRRARKMEWAADTPERRLAAQTGTARLIQAARVGRWSIADIADALEVTRATVTARLRLTDAAPPAPGGVTVPPRRRAAPRRRPRQPLPVEEGWLNPGQACLLAGVRRRSLTRWRLAGLLPGSRPSESGRWLYRREDLEAVMARRDGRTGLPHGTFTPHSAP